MIFEIPDEFLDAKKKQHTIRQSHEIVGPT